MDSSLAPFIDIRVSWAARHRLTPQIVSYSSVGSNTLWLMLRGKAEITVEERVWPLEANTAFLITPAHKRTFLRCTQAMEMLTLGFDAVLFNQFKLLEALERPALWHLLADEYSLLEVLMDKMALLHSQRAEYKEKGLVFGGAERLAYQGLGQTIFGLCWKQLETRRMVEMPSQFAIKWLTRALSYLRRNPSTSVAAWAREVGFSPSQFRRVFQANIGVSPQIYLVRFRLEQARLLLHTTDAPIAVIAEQLGFHSPQHFSKLFKNTSGFTPSAYRRTANSAAGDPIEPAMNPCKR